MDLEVIARVLWLRGRMRRREGWSRAQVEAHRDAELRRLREFAVRRSPFYRELHRGLENKPLHDLPVVTKRDLMTNFDRVVTDERIRLDDVVKHQAALAGDDKFLGRYRLSSTSGSSGFKGLFLHDDREWATVIASYNRANEWAGIRAPLTRVTRIAVVSSRTAWMQSARVAATLQTRFVSSLRLDALQPMPEIVAALNAFQPESLVGYASMQRLLAEEKLAGRLRIAPRAVMCASEVLTSDARAVLRAAWGFEPFNVYAATETAGIASECERHTGMHLYEDLVIAELVDEKNRPVPPGTPAAKVLATVLFGRTQPLIRYQIDDCPILSGESCVCGRPFALLAGIEGRTEDTLTITGDGDGVRVYPNVFHVALEDWALAGWQVTQTAPNALAVRVVPGQREIDVPALGRALEVALTKQGARPALDVRVVSEIPKSPNGKAPLVKGLAK